MSEYNQRLHCLNTPVSGARRWGYPGAVAFGLVFGCLLINLLATRPFWKPDLGTLSDRIETLREHRQEIDTVFIGSSRIQSSVNPLIFDEVVAAAGSSTSSYSLWIAGGSYTDSIYSLDTVSEIGLPNLKYIVIEPMLFLAPNIDVVSGYTNAYSAQVRYIFTLARSSTSIALAIDSSRPWRSKAKDLFALLTAASIHISNLGVFADIFLQERRIEPLQQNVWAHRGQQPPKDESTVKTPKGFADWQPNFDASYRQLSQREERALARLVRQTHEIGATPVFLIPPSAVAIDLQRAIYASLTTNFPDVAVLSYIVTEPRQLIYDNPNYWIDNRGHLGLNGSQYFSRQLGHDWVTSIANTHQPEGN